MYSHPTFAKNVAEGSVNVVSYKSPTAVASSSWRNAKAKTRPQLTVVDGGGADVAAGCDIRHAYSSPVTAKGVRGRSKANAER